MIKARRTARRANKQFAVDIVAAIDERKILGIRAGMQPHRIIGIWAVVVEGRVFVRSWEMKRSGWFHTFLEDPRGIIQIANREIPVRAVRTRGERIKDAVDLAYAAKYRTPASMKYVNGFARGKRKETTTELLPL